MSFNTARQKHSASDDIPLLQMRSTHQLVTIYGYTNNKLTNT